MSQPDRAAFEAALQAEGFTEILLREIPPGADIAEHQHPYDAHGLVLAGHFTVSSAASEQPCGPGEAWSLHAGTPHREAAGPAGATMVIGRRHPTPVA